MMLGERGRGFFAGAVGGLLLALLVVGAGSFLLPREGVPPQQAALVQNGASSSVPGVGGAPYGSPNSTVTVVSTENATFTLTCDSGSSESVPPPQGGGGAEQGCALAISASVITSTEVAGGGSQYAVSQYGGAAGENQPAPSASTTTSSTSSEVFVGALALGSQGTRPSSTLTMLASERLGALLSAIAPLLVALLLASLIYGVYVRRQGSEVE